MKSFLIGLLTLFASLLLIHLGLLVYHRPLQRALEKQYQEKKNQHTLKQTRLEMEARQRAELNSYGRSSERSEYVEIPLERAFDYYLRQFHTL